MFTTLNYSLSYVYKMEEEEKQEATQGVVYGYLEQLEAGLPENDKVIIELHFRKDVKEIPTKRDGDVFIIDRRMRLPLNIKLDSDIILL